MKTSILGLALLISSTWAFGNSLPQAFEGSADFSNCSGFLLRPQARELSKKAWVLTNGHCVTNWLGRMQLKPGQAFGPRSAGRDVALVTRAGVKTAFRTQRLIYATMTGTDLAVYELAESYQQLERMGISAFELTTEAPVDGLKVTLFSAHKDRSFSCAIDAVLAGLREGGFEFKDSLRLTDECQQSNGTSGSPMVISGTRQVVAINNSYNKQGRACTDHNPCEIDEDGDVSVFHGARYAQQVLPLASCLQQGELELGLAGCQLTRPSRP